jgi:hypothetical protein
MSVRVLAALTLAVLTTAGCSGTDDATSEPTTSGSTAVGPTLAVPPDEAKAVIQDWYVDGIFNSPHRCEAVRAAIARLPTSPREYTTVYDDMRSLERRTCT